MGFFSTSKSDRAVEISPAPNSASPICPYCELPIDEIYARSINMFGKTWLFFCTNCSKVLGVSQRKTVPMG